MVSSGRAIAVVSTVIRLSGAEVSPLEKPPARPTLEPPKFLESKNGIDT